MEITVSNRIRIKNPPEALKMALISELSLPNPKFEDAQRNGYSTYKIPPLIHNFSILPDDSLLIPRGYIKKLLLLLKSLGLDERVIDTRHIDPPNFNIDSSHIKLRDYQMKAITALVTAGEEGLLIAPAGSGKTVMGVSLIPMLGQKMLWLTHTKPLMEQVVERLHQFFPWMQDDDIGTIGAGKWKIGDLFTAAMVQTLVRRPIETHALKGQFGVVILDEAHHAPATTFTQVLGSLDPYYLYGLTATHIRRDGLHNLMFQTLGGILHEVPLDDVKKHGGIIVPEVWYRNINTTNIASNDFQTIIKLLVEDSNRTNLIVNDIVNEAVAGNICVVITERKIHADLLLNRILTKWPKAGIVTGSYSDKHNKAELARLRNEEITVLVATSALLGEGFDHAPINRGFLCLPFRNMVKTEQVVGRIQRTSEGKKDAVIYDYVDNHSLLQHQFRNAGAQGCRYNIYKKLGCSLREL